MDTTDELLDVLMRNYILHHIGWHNLERIFPDKNESDVLLHLLKKKVT